MVEHRVLTDEEIEEHDRVARIDLHGTVEVPRAALYGFRDFVNRFCGASVSTAEVAEKMRWLDSLLEGNPR